MVKRVVKYVDYNGDEQEETCYFSLTKVELAMLDSSYEGGFQAYVDSIVNGENVAALISVLADVFSKAYGEMSPDGKRFLKNKDKTEAFRSSEVFSELIFSILQNPEEAKIIGHGLLTNAK